MKTEDRKQAIADYKKRAQRRRRVRDPLPRDG